MGVTEGAVLRVWVRCCLLEKLFRVPGVYLGSASSQFFAILPFRGINNLRVFNILNSSIPTAPTSFLILI